MPKAPFANCEECPLRNRPFVPPCGDKDKALFAIVGEAPGQTEAQQKAPFVGASGKILELSLNDIGVSRDDVWITNAVLCHPLGNETPSALAIQCCRPRLLSELSTLRTKVVVASGAVSAQALLGVKSFKITKERGKMIRTEHGMIVPTLHPAFILRKGRGRKDLTEDLSYAKQLSHNGWTSSNPYAEKDDPFIVLSSVDEVISLLETFLEDDEFVFYDFETTGLDPHTAEVLCLVFYSEKRGSFILPKDLFYLPQVRGALNTFFSKARKLGGHNLAFDNAVLEANGINPPEHAEDTLLLHYITDEQPDRHGLKDIAIRLLRVEDWEAPIKEVLKSCPIEHVHHYGCIPKQVLYKYAAKDVTYNGAIQKILAEQVDSLPKGRYLYETVLWPASELVREIKVRGLRIDVGLLENSIQYMRKEAERIERELQTLVQLEDFNPRSPMQIANYLFEVLSMPVLGATEKGRPSTSEEALSLLEEHLTKNGHQNAEQAIRFIGLLKEYRQAAKILNTYLIPIYEQCHLTGRAYPDLLIHGTVTGRLSGGVWLTLPRETTNKYAGIVRSLVIPDDGCVLISADFDQIELRVGAVESKDEVFRQVFLNGEDPHAATADALFGPQWRDRPDAKEWRQKGKTFNFAAWYGASAKKLAESTGVSEVAAQTLLMRFYQAHPRILEWKREVALFLQKNGYVESFFGRRRRVDVLTDANWGEILREAVNFPIQATANDLNLIAAHYIWRTCDLPILFLFHDSILTQVPDNGNAQDIARTIVEVASQRVRDVYSDFVPFTMDFEIRERWGKFVLPEHPEG